MINIFSISILLVVFLTDIITTSFKVRKFYATTTNGLENVLYNEILQIPNVLSVKQSKCGVTFSGDDIVGFKALIGLRTSLKLMELISESNRINNKDNLYDFIHSIDWSEYINLSDTLKCDSVLGRVSQELSHSHFTSLTVKNSIVDQFRDRYGRRPSVNIDNPDVSLLCYIHNDKASLYRVWSGIQSMHKRGYRDIIHKAALRESTAAALLLLSNYQCQSERLIDPMCGSGTIAIEAALMACNTAPGLIKYNRNRNLPDPLKWNDVSKISWETVWDEAIKSDKRKDFQSSDIPSIIANDYHEGAIHLAVKSAENAGVKHLIQFQNIDVNDMVIDNKSDISYPIKVIANPPWDQRLKAADNSWKHLSNFYNNFSLNQRMWLLTGNEELYRNMNQSPIKKITFQAASVDFTFANF